MQISRGEEYNQSVRYIFFQIKSLLFATEIILLLYIIHEVLKEVKDC